ncbi:MAG: MFS transporter [Chloroflexota bacterium]|nr:MAG: MFS transporter [Chloroflexota bacterium]
MLARGWATARGWRNPPATDEARNIRYLIAQTACAGVVNGGITTFLPVLLARFGAGAMTVSWLSSGLALTSIVMALPAGPIVERQRRLVPWSANYYYSIRGLFFLIALAAFLPTPVAIPLVVILWSLHGIPAAIGNNAWYSVLADAVSPRRRPSINGLRWALLGLVSAGCVAGFGILADALPIPLGYQAIFIVSTVIGALGIFFYSRITIPDHVPRETVATHGWRERIRALAAPLTEGGDFLHYTIGTSLLRIGLHLPIGLYSVFWVNDLMASDTMIGLRSLVGNLALTFGYYGWGRLAARLGHRRVLGFSAAGLAFYPALTASAPTVEWLLPAALIWGLFASGIDMSLFEGLLDVCPADRRAEFVAVNTFVANVIAFAAPLLGAAFAIWLTIRPVFWIAAALHLVTVAAVVYLAQRAARNDRTENGFVPSPSGRRSG